MIGHVPAIDSRFSLVDGVLGVGTGIGATGTFASPLKCGVSATEPMERMYTKLTTTFVMGGAIHGSNGKGQESDEFELHDVREGGDGSSEGCNTTLL